MNDPFTSVNPYTKKREFTLVSLGAIILIMAGVVIWQWFATMNELDAITEGEVNRYSNFLPKQVEGSEL